MPAHSLREIEDTLRHADPQKRHQTLRAVADLFLSSAPSLDEAHVEVFDTVFETLLEEPHRSGLPELSQRLAPIGNAPPRLVKRLAHDNDILVAGPVLSQSPRLSADDLCEIARTKGNGHMLAMSTRSDLTEPVTDILVHKGDQQVARSVANNRAARLSPQGLDKLVQRAESDESISASLSTRTEIEPELLKAALTKATARAELSTKAVAAAMRLAISLKQTNGLHDEQIAAFANGAEYENLIAAISVRANLKYEVIDNLMRSDKIAGIVLVCKSIATPWNAAEAILRLAMRRNHSVTEAEITSARRDFLALSRATAERIVRFWQLRQSVSSTPT
ncbi:MAG: DUF2336 domain-containing protein [Sphingomicrobium sp.]